MKRALLSMLFLLIFLHSQGQTGRTKSDSRGDDIIYEHEIPKSFTLKHVTGAYEHKEHTNNIIMRMGELEGLNPPSLYRTELRYVEKVSIEKSGDDLRLKMSIKFTEFISTGRRSSFDFSSYLLPGGMNFRVQLLDAAGEVVFNHEVKQCNISSWGKESDVETFGFGIQDEYQHEGLKMRITEIVSPKPMLLFFHTPDQQDRLFGFLKMIKEYEKDAALVKEKAKQAEAIKPDNPERFRQQLDMLESYKADVDNVISKNWLQKLRLSKPDPAGLNSALEAFASSYNDTRTVLQQGLRTLDDSYYNRGMEFMRKQDYDNALVWFNKALEINPGHARSHFQIATIDYRRGRFEESATRLNRILSTMSPDRTLSAEIHNLLKEVQASMADLYFKTYRSIISEAERELSRGKTDDALKALNRASVYQIENSIYITSNDEVVALSDKIARRISGEAERDCKSGSYREAMDRYEDLKTSFKIHAPKVKIPVHVEKRISEITETYVDSRLNQARISMRKDDYKKTGAIINELIQASEKHTGIKSSETINRFIYQYMMELYLKGQKLLYRKSFAMAFEVFNQCLRLINEYKLTVPPDLYRMMDEARHGVFTDLLFAGQEAMNSRDFDGAEFYLKEALSFLQNRPTGTARTAVEAYKVNLMNAFISEGKKLITAMDFERAIIIFDRAIEAQYTYGILSPVNIPDLILEAREGIGVRMLGNIQMRSQYYSDAIRSFDDVWNYLDNYGLFYGSAYHMFIKTGEALYRSILSTTDQAIRAKNYDSALELLGNAKYLCDKYPVGCIPEDIHQTESAIRQGVYNSLVGDAEKAIARGDFNQAANMIQQAEQYRQQWGGYVVITNEANAVLGKIRHNNYKQSVATGKSLLDRKDYRQALIHFDEAFALEQEGGFTADKKLREYRVMAALKTIMAEADQLEQMLGQANYMATKDKMLQLMTLRAKYDLQDNKELEARFRSLQSRMVSAACLQQQSIFEEHMEKAFAFENERQYISAGEEYRLAASAALKHPECYLSDSMPNRNIDRITPAIKYQEKIDLSERLLSEYKNSEALNQYVDAEALYNNGNLRIFGIKHEPLADYALKQNLNYILAAAYYYREKGDLAVSLRMLEALSNKGYPPKQTRLLQEQIGFRFGQQDRAKYSGSTWKVAVLQYTSGKKFYKYFRNAYKKGWKSK